jgi:glutathione synthase/RimK-type ligase-like ATP-grasp enzyme
MPTLLVVDEDNPLPGCGGLAVSAIDYIKGAGAELPPGTVVRNIATNYAYMSRAYYVALLAEARGHVSFPNVLDLLTSDPQPDCMAPRKSSLAAAPCGDFGRREARTIGVLLTPEDRFAASSFGSLTDFTRAAAALGLPVEFFGRGEIAHALDHLAGLFVRDLTNPTNHAFRAALSAEARGVPVIDDPRSIIRCSNKVFVHEVLARNGISTPQTLLVTPDMRLTEVVGQLGLPLVLKTPDGSFSLGVHRADSLREGERILAGMRSKSAVVIAQEFMPTEFDWRIGILDGQPLFACRYFMAPGHWQIGAHVSAHERIDGEAHPVALQDVSPALIDTAREAASSIGSGLYGVDLKQQGGRSCVVIEVNDNPDIDSECEAGLPDSSVWSRLAGWFASRVAEGRSKAASRHETLRDRLPLTA